MTHVIAEPCVDVTDRSCVAACPVDCIVDLGHRLAIDPTGCIDCGACVPACPVSAIFPVDEVPTEWRSATPQPHQLVGAPLATPSAVVPPAAAHGVDEFSRPEGAGRVAVGRG